MMPLTFAVGSLNPVKIRAVTTAVHHHWPQAMITGVDVPSGISAMPLDDAESLRGARQRAEAAQTATTATIGCGLEGHVYSTPAGWFLSGWVVLHHQDGRQSVGGCPRIPFPLGLTPRLQAGEMLGDIMDELLNTDSIRTKEGAIGAFTNGGMTRHDAFAAAVAAALAPFVTPDLYL
ncbi:MAG TPA: inosine/xanthosine triphosphatase [Anaerolineae bacterium]|nr:inosine/xanthosine triphosphatase [Anaerolineae bacterium]